jgi:membrane-associated phospholipid phosphatase
MTSDGRPDRPGDGEARGFPRPPTTIWVLAGDLVVCAVLIVLARTTGGPVHRFDIGVETHLNHYLTHHRGQLALWKDVSNVGGPSTWRVLAALAVVILWVRGRRRPAIVVAAAMVAAAVLSSATKVLVGRPRPTVPLALDHAGGKSFPSGHALNSFVAIGLLVALAWPVVGRGWRAFLTVLAIVIVGAIGFSRLILGVHYPTDVLGGWAIGLALVLIALAAARGGAR